MIKRLRWRLVIVTMVLLGLVLALTMYLFFSSTYRGLEQDSLNALHLAGMRYGLHEAHPEGEEPADKPAKEEEPPGKPEKPDRNEDGKGSELDQGKPREEQKSAVPCFVVGYDHSGQLYSGGTRYYDLTDQVYLEQLVTSASETGEDHGVLWGEKLRYLRLDDICGQAYAFTDISGEVTAMVRLMYQYQLIGLLAMLAFFLISLLTSRWAVRPIATVMEQQRQFVADASHELKTPLTVILTNAELLASEDYSLDDKIRFTDNILTMSQQMRGLVEELLDLARVDSGTQRLAKVPLDLSRLISDAALPFEPMYFEAGKTLDIRIEQGIHLSGEPDSLTRAVNILLDNGCKYSLEGSTVALELKRCGLKACLITVTSRGDTLTGQECRDIFKRFYRRDPSRKLNHSYGLGLPIARTIVQRHGGKICARSKNGVNTFSIRLQTGR